MAHVGETKNERIEGTRLVRRLVEEGILTEEQVRLALREQERRRQPLRRVIIDLGLVSPEKLAEFLAKEAHCQVVDLNQQAIDFSLFDQIPTRVCRQLVAVPFARVDGRLLVAMADPLDVEAIDVLRQLSGMEVEVYAAPEPDIIAVIDRKERAEQVEESVDALIRKELLERAPEVPQPEEPLVEDVTEEDAPIIQLVNRIIHQAVEEGASDIHFEPQAKYMRVRMRIDGMLSTELFIPKGLQSAVTARLKVLGNMDVTESRLPQDGRANVLVGRRVINLRLSSLPSAYGENVVIRILDTASRPLSISKLGMSKETEAKLRQLIQSPYGVVIVTGPTGSGKTTTLYSVLNELNTVERSIFTLEDPIEYRLEGLCQTEVKEDIGLTFDAGLRTLLRQDPDVILVGETRDQETARLMVRAALTGHLVFTTLHTNDAVGAIPRLLDMGVEPYLLPGSLIGVIAQRLVRCLCPKCKRRVIHLPDYLRRFQIEWSPEWEGKDVFEASGCAECRQSGYRGRHAIFELLAIDASFHELILRRAPAGELKELARQKGMKTLFEDGLRLIYQGITDLKEVLRVVPISE